MSKTKKGSKGPGFDYWSKRPGTKKASSPGKFSKKLNIKKERKIGKKINAEDL